MLVYGFICLFFATSVAGSAQNSRTWFANHTHVRTTLEILDLDQEITIRMCGLGWSYVAVQQQGFPEEARLDPTRRLDPGWTYYSRIAYTTMYTLPPLIIPGNITLNFYLGGGHFASNWYDAEVQETLLFAEILQGNNFLRGTNDSQGWECDASTPPRRRSASLYGGETFNLLVRPTWASCTSTYQGPATLIPADFAPVRTMESLAWQKTWRETHTYHAVNDTVVDTFDFGQNIAGVLNITLTDVGCQQNGSSRVIILQHAELLWPNGTLNRINLGLANATDVLILPQTLNGSTYTYQPEFTYHGFRYASAQHDSCVVVTDLTAVVIHSAVEEVGSFKTSDRTLQGIHNITVWSQRSNLMSIPTDCPQRDERLGWLADAHLSSEEALLNFNMTAFYRAFTRDNMAIAVEAVPGGPPDPGDFVPGCDAEDGKPTTKCNRKYTRPSDLGWGAALVIIPHNTYRLAGDLAIIRDSFTSLDRYASYVTSLASASGGIITYGDFGDWEALSKVDTSLVSTYFLHDVQKRMAEICEALSNTTGYSYWLDIANQTKVAFNAAFFDKASCTYKTTLGFQSAHALPLYGGLVSHGYEACVAQTLVSYIQEGDVCPSGNGSRCFPGHLSVGIVGAQALLSALSANGYHTLALTLARMTTFPSWGFMLSEGATTLWEQWPNTFLPSDGASHNHVMFGSIDVWLYEHYGGLQPKGIVDIRNVCAMAGDNVTVTSRGRTVKHVFDADMNRYRSTIVGAVEIRHSGVRDKGDGMTESVVTQC